MKISKIFALTVATLSAATVMHASVPILVATPARMRAVKKLVTDAQDQLQNGDVVGAKRNVDAVLQRDPTFWPALYVRAQIYSHEGKYDLALKDCKEALRQDLRGADSRDAIGAPLVAPGCDEIPAIRAGDEAEWVDLALARLAAGFFVDEL